MPCRQATARGCWPFPSLQGNRKGSSIPPHQCTATQGLPQPGFRLKTHAMTRPQIILLFLFLVFLTFVPLLARLPAFLRPVGPPGLLAVQMPEGKEARSTALFITGKDGWGPEETTRAQRLSEMHTMVLVVDGEGLLTRVGGDCTALGTALADLARTQQQEHGALARTPVLVGLPNGGGSIALAAATTGGTAQFKGLVTLDLKPDAAPCPPSLTEAQKAPVRWLDVTDTADTSVAQGITGATIVAPDPDPRKAFYQSYLRVAGTDSAFDLGSVAQSVDLADLPLTIHRDADAPASDVYAIFLSGDGGWATFDEEVSDRLAADGIPVVGISALRYLWQEKRPEQIAADIARIDAHYRRAFGAERVMLVGFSLGGNTMPFAVNKLPTELQDQIASVALLAPEQQTGFEIRVGGWLGQATGATEVTPEIDRLAGTLPADKILCLFGTKEKVSACPGVTAPIAKHSFEGGHHLAKDYDSIAALLTQAVQ